MGGIKPLIIGIGSILLGVFAHKVPAAVENLKANFNSWFAIGEGSNIQTVTFTKPDAARSKWRVKLEASAVTTDQKFENMSETTEIEFAVNSLPTMEATTLKISPITVPS